MCKVDFLNSSSSTVHFYFPELFCPALLAHIYCLCITSYRADQHVCIIKGIEATLLHTLQVATRGQAQPCLIWFHANLNQAMCFEGNRMPPTVYTHLQVPNFLMNVSIKSGLTVYYFLPKHPHMHNSMHLGKTELLNIFIFRHSMKMVKDLGLI